MLSELPSAVLNYFTVVHKLSSVEDGYSDVNERQKCFWLDQLAPDYFQLLIPSFLLVNEVVLFLLKQVL